MRTSKISLSILAALCVLGTFTWRADSHCQVPCGIYDDDTRLTLIAEHIKTIDKAARQITVLGSAKEVNYNQLIRWVNNKDKHADELGEIVTYYFMAQRVKPADPTDKKAYAAYVEKLTLLHRMLVASMKAKQNTDPKYTKELSELLHQFTHAYGSKTHKHP